MAAAGAPGSAGGRGPGWGKAKEAVQPRGRALPGLGGGASFGAGLHSGAGIPGGGTRVSLASLAGDQRSR